jgi:hypothetical protein
MERVAGGILLRLNQQRRLIPTDQIPQVRMRIISIHESCLGYLQRLAGQLNCRLPE